MKTPFSYIIRNINSQFFKYVFPHFVHWKGWKAKVSSSNEWISTQILFLKSFPTKRKQNSLKNWPILGCSSYLLLCNKSPQNLVIYKTTASIFLMNLQFGQDSARTTYLCSFQCSQSFRGNSLPGSKNHLKAHTHVGQGTLGRLRQLGLKEPGLD